MESVENINKVNKKLVASAKRIIKLRKRRGTDLKDLEKIDELIQCPVEEPPPAPLHKVDVQPEVKIPEYAPGLSLVDLNRIDGLFSENGLKLKNFASDQNSLFGHSLVTLSDTRFRSLLLARIYEVRSSGIKEGVSLYVLYLLSCTSNPVLALVCTEFLHRFPCHITSSIVIQLLLNFGISSEAFGHTDLQYQLPEHLSSEKLGRDTLPIFNMEKVFDYVSFCIEENLLKCDGTTEPLITAFAKLPLDRYIGWTPLVATLSRLVSLLSVRCSALLGCSVVANNILNGVDPLNQLEIFRLVVRPDPPLHRAFLRLLIKNNTTRNVPFKPSFGVPELRKVILACKKHTDPLQIFIAIHVLISVVSMVTFTTKDIEILSHELSSIENSAKSLSTYDHVRLHSVCAQLRGLIMMARII